MGITLVKRQDRYDLYGADDAKIASSAKNPFGKLSKENCDYIFGIVDVDKFSHEHCDRLYHEGNINWEKYRIHFKEGFNKAMELQKDKLFTAEDVKKAIILSMSYNDATVIKLLRQQPTEIEVEMVMDDIFDGIDSARIFPKEETSIPMLDKDGCLILKRK
jgi:hypothetical protein